MTRTKLILAFALVFVPLAALPSAPAARDKIHLAPAGKVKVDNLVVNDAAVIDENRVAIVGLRADPAADISQRPAMNDGVPNGAIIDLAKKSVQHFANQHTTQISGVAPCGGRLVTSSSDLGAAFLRSWDLKTQQSKEVFKLDGALAGSVRRFHKSDRVVMAVTGSDDSDDTGLFVFDLAKPKRMKLPCPAGFEFLSEPLAVSADDTWVACNGDKDHPDQVVCFKVATKKPTVVTISPKDAGQKWSVFGLTFSPSGKLFVCRGGRDDEVPKGKDEKDMPAERRGIVRIDLPGGKVVPLNMGHTLTTSNCAVDGRETWLATIGISHPDERVKEEYAVSELRIYNLASGKLAYREQLKKERPGWVWFTPSGKRLVCVTSDGTVRWWDVPMP